MGEFGGLVEPDGHELLDELEDPDELDELEDPDELVELEDPEELEELNDPDDPDELDELEEPEEPDELEDPGDPDKLEDPDELELSLLPSLQLSRSLMSVSTPILCAMTVSNGHSHLMTGIWTGVS